MPSSLTVNLPSASVYSTQPPVSVYGTGRMLAFPGTRLSSSLRPKARLWAPFRRCSDASGMRHFITCVLMTINTIPLGFPVRVILRTRLTQGRLTWPWNPWLFGVGVSRPHYRYLCLHLLFRTLQHASRPIFAASGMLPYHTCVSVASAVCFIPAHYPCRAARLVSCYALFK